MAALLRSFPAGTDEDSPELALVYAIAGLDQLRLDQAAAHLEAARAYAATAPPDRQRRLGMAIGRLNCCWRGCAGTSTACSSRPRRFSPVTARPAPTALGSDLRALALMNLGVTEAWSPRLTDGEQHLLEGAALARGIGRPYLEVACLAHLGFASTVHSFTLARGRCEQAIALAARHGWDTERVIAPALATLAGVLIWTGEFDRGQQWLDRAAAPPSARANQASGCCCTW